MCEQSAWRAEIPWEEGTEADFADFKEKMANAKISGAINESSSGDESSENEEVVKDKVTKRFADYNRFVDTESEEEDDPDQDEDPGSGNPEQRILWAAQHNKMEIAEEMLREKPGLVGARDEDLYTPLHRASYNNHLKMARFLLRSGADPRAETDTGWTPLHSAAKWNNVQIAELMLNAGVSVNHVSEGGLTPLHVAAMSTNCRETVELLLMQSNVDLYLLSNQGDSARDIAERSGPLSPLFDAAIPRSIQAYRKT